MPDDAAVKVYGCPRCGATDPSCEQCGGDGFWLLDRCPHALYDGEATRIVQLAQWMSSQVVVLPVAGGWVEQAAVFCDLALFAMQLLGHYDAEDRDKREREARRQWRKNRSK